jgi:hypothetical protein
MVRRDYQAVVISMTEYRVNTLRAVRTFAPDKRADAVSATLRVRD